MTKFAFEVPTAHLQDFHDLQDFYFVLTIQMEDDRFADFMISQVVIPGLHAIWVDNSFNETGDATHHHDILEVYNTLKAQKMIPPDALDWTPEQIGNEVHEMMRHTIPQHNIVPVIAYFDTYSHLYMEFLAVVTYAIPYMTRSNWDDEDLEWVHRRSPFVHYLGLNSIDELTQWKPFSVDTGMPIKLAMQNKTLQQWEQEGCPHIYNKDLGSQGMDYFNATLTTEQVKLARRNIWELKQRVQTLA